MEKGIINFRRLWVIFKARNREFFRDKAAFGWNFLFPFLLIAGFAVIFGGKERSEYKVGFFPGTAAESGIEATSIPAEFQNTRQIEFIGFDSLEKGLDKLRHHKIDLLLKQNTQPYAYWVSTTSPKGYVVEQILLANLLTDADRSRVQKNEIKGDEIRYIDWLFPGILGMNMMFSALFGVGWVVVRYRKMGVLKRLKATPLTAFEYLSAQMLSRIFLLMFTLVIMWGGCNLIFSFTMAGSLVDLFIIFFLGGLCLTSMGLIVAARGTSEEFANGVLNMISWPMMFLSGVWFSLEGAPDWVKLFAKLFPLTHLLSGARKIMNDGATLMDVGSEVTMLCLMTLIFLTVGASLFSWNK